MDEKHVVVGAGPVGQATARELVRQGIGSVLLVSRSGTGAAIDGVERVAADAADAERLVELAAGAAAIYNCINPPSYDVWESYWPPVAAAFLTTAERTGAVLVTAGCLYPLGVVDGPMTEATPDATTGAKGRLRARMWADARTAHEAGRIRAVEVRGSDYLGPAITSAHVTQVLPAALAGKAVRFFGRTDQPHSYTDVRDMARALVAVAITPSAQGRGWHAPTNPARTQRETLDEVLASVGRDPVRVRTWPRAMTSLGGVFVPFLREMREMRPSFERPYVLDSSAIERELGLFPTPWAEVCRATAADHLAADDTEDTASPESALA